MKLPLPKPPSHLVKQRKPAKSNKSNIQAQLDVLSKQFHQLRSAGRHHDALIMVQKAHQLIPNKTAPLSDMATCYIHLEAWDDAITTAKKIIAIDHKHLNAYDVLSHAYGAKRDWRNAGVYGWQALMIRDELILDKSPTPPAIAPSFMDLDQDSKQNLIAFSLFGDRSEYIETAVINAQIVGEVYPNWQCRYYVDDSVPQTAIDRLMAAKAQVIQVKGDAASLPGTMWRFLAMDDASLGCVLFRDVDSVISHREAASVREWIDSGKTFHTIRDSGSHTELILAGLWGAKAGSVPNMLGMMMNYLAENPKRHQHTDQFFLRYCVWPYVRQDVYASDRIFGFMDAHPITDVGFDFDKTHIGCDEGSSIFTLTSSTLQQGDRVVWRLYSQIDPALNADLSHRRVDECLICDYETIIEQDNTLMGKIPRIYARGIPTGETRIDFKKLDESV